MESSNRRLTLFEQLSAVDNGRNTLAGLTLDDILGNSKRTEPPQTQSRTLLDIIREDGFDKDKKSWKTFRDKLRLKRTGSAWTSSVPISASDFHVLGNRSQFSGRSSIRLAESARGGDGNEVAPVSDRPFVNSRLQLGQRGSVRFGQNPSQTDYADSADVSMQGDAPSSRSFRPSNTGHHSTRFPSSNATGNDVDSSDDDSPVAREGARRLGAALEEERALSAREAVAAQEAAAAAAAEQASAENNAPPIFPAEEPMRMSLMALLEETDRQIGMSGSRYSIDEDDDSSEEEEEKKEEEKEVVVEASKGVEFTCCVCMIRHKGAAFIPCGHTFCRLCSRELWVQRGNCPLCNGFILEILDIF